MGRKGVRVAVGVLVGVRVGVLVGVRVGLGVGVATATFPTSVVCPAMTSNVKLVP